MLNTFGLKLPFLADEIVAGDVRFVDSGGSKTLDDPNYGKTTEKTLATWDYAVGKMTANNGDFIIILPGHTESIALVTTVAHDQAGLTVIGLGRGSNRPTFTQTVVGAYVAVTGANTVLRNLLFKAGVDTGTEGLLDIDAIGVLIENCKLENITNALHTDYLLQTDDTDNACDDLIIRNCEFDAGSGGNGDCHAAILLQAVNDSVRIDGCTVTGNYEDAGIFDNTHTLTNLHICNNLIENTYAAKECIELLGPSTGFLTNNRFYASALLTMLNPGSLKCSGNLGSVGVDAAAVPVPVVPDGTPKIVLKSTGDLTGAAATTALFTVTGDVLCRVCASVDVAITGAATADPTLEIGVVGNTAALCVQDAVDSTAFAVGDSWSLITAADANAAETGDEWILIGNSVDIGLKHTGVNLTAGDMDVYCEYIPLTEGSCVVAA